MQVNIMLLHYCVHNKNDMIFESKSFTFSMSQFNCCAAVLFLRV